MRGRPSGTAIMAGLCCAVAGFAASPAVADHGEAAHSAGDPDRVFELVSPADKPAGIGVGTTYTGPTSLGWSGTAAYLGDRFAAEGSYGSTVIDAPFALANDVALAERVGDQAGWASRPALTHPLFTRELTRFMTTRVATPDFDRIGWSPNGNAPIFPEMAAWPAGNAVSYISDWQGRWELLDRTDPTQAESGTGQLTETALSADGRVALSTGRVHRVAGPGDPSHDRLAGRSVYLFDASGELTDAFPASNAADRYTLANTCAGSGADRTRIPRRLAGGLLGDQPCPPKPANRDERLISPYGASAAPAFYGTARLLPPRGVLSADGRRAFFSAPDPVLNILEYPATSECNADLDAATKCPAQLYVRQTHGSGNAAVRWLSRPEPGLLGAQQASLLGPALFEGASEDGDKVFFRTPSPLTADDRNGAGVAPPPGGVTTGSASGQSWDLYMFDLADGPDPTGPGSSLTRISAGPDGPDGDSHGDGDCNNPQGPGPAASLRFVSDDGSRVYFACSGELPGAVVSSDPARLTSPAGSSPTSTDQTNLYLYDANRADPDERWRFVARIPRAARVSAADSGPGHAKVCASTGGVPVSPFGAQAQGVFDFNKSGAGGANCVSGTSDGAFVTFFTPGRLTADDPANDAVDVYGYDAETDELTRISGSQAGPDAAYDCLAGNDSQGASFPCHGDVGWAPAPAANPFLGVATDPEVPGDRVAFFQSRSPLVAGDVDSAYDVYRWRNGELSLITTGASSIGDGAVYRGNDVTGRSVYFATRDALTWQDADAVADVYVARLGGKGIPRPAEPPVCAVLADACRAATAPLAGPQPGATNRPGGGDASPRARKTLTLGRLSRRARLRASRSGTLRLSVRTTGTGRVRIVARGRLGGKTARELGSASWPVRTAGVVKLKLRLSSAARKRLRRGRVLRVTLRVSQRGTRARTMTVRLPGVPS